jgi:hypothetical protein
METGYLQSAIKQVEYYKLLGEKSFEQLTEEQLLWQANEASNSIAIIVNHLWGNMMSRWTDFLTTDGEKEWRNRDAEFELEITSRAELLHKWNEGWNCFLGALNGLQEEDLGNIIYIRNMGHTVMEAINRQLAHYPYHIGQIVFVAKLVCDEKWVSLSIPKGNSQAYNSEKFAKPKRTEHFTDELLGKKKDDL